MNCACRLVFRRRSDSSSADGNHNNGADAYENWLAGDAAENTLRRVSRWLGRAVEQFSVTAAF
jgi:hypothetical protein